MAVSLFFFFVRGVALREEELIDLKKRGKN